MASYFDQQGKRVDLTKELARGGEGAVFEVAGQADIVAKIYHKPLTQDKAAKVSAMASLPADRLARIAAWPLSTVHQKPGAPVCGLLMPKVSGFKEVHTLYGPKSRLAQFPNATWPFLVHTAMNAARAFAVIHEQGHVIGDVNQSNLYVSDKSTVKLIDCDSFQIVQNGHAYLCAVGVPTHTPPELQGKPFHSVTRSANHDNFGLAIIIFQLLFMGRHPFSGQYLGPGEMSIEKAISEFRFAYGPGAASRQMKQPPATLPFTAIPDQVALLFEQAFNPSGTKPGGRPRAQDWVNALSSVAKDTKSCRQNTGHHYLKTLAECPWCELETKSGVVLFKAVIIATSGPAGTFNIEVVWSKILSVPHPGPLPAPPVAIAKIMPSPVIQAARQRRRILRWICCGIVALLSLFTAAVASSFTAVTMMIVFFIVAFNVANRPARQLKPKAYSALKMMEAQHQSVQQRWNREAGSQDFDRRVTELKTLKDQLLGLETQRQDRLRQLEQGREKKQFEDYMDRFKIQNATIDGIGQGRMATLQSYGIETAGDITEYKILSIPGFGPSLTSRLLAWRRWHEQSFVYNPSTGVDPADITAVNQEFASLKTKLEQELQNAPPALQQLSQQIQHNREVLKPTLTASARALAVARADHEAIR